MPLKIKLKSTYKMGTTVDGHRAVRYLITARTLDHLKLGVILAKSAPEVGVGIAYMNR